MEYLEGGNRETHSRWGIVVADVAESDSTVSDDISEQRVPVRSHPNALRRSIAATPPVLPSVRLQGTSPKPYFASTPSLLLPRSEAVRIAGRLTHMTAESVHSRACSGALVTILPTRRYVADERALTVALYKTQLRRSIVADGIVTLGMLSAKQHRSGCNTATR